MRFSIDLTHAESIDALYRKHDFINKNYQHEFSQQIKQQQK